MKTENSVKKEIPGRFKKGQSGNPAGKPKGTRHRATMAMLELLKDESQALARVCVDRALEGDIQALKLCLDRICPPSKDHPFEVTLPKVSSVDDLPAFTGSLLDAVADGTLPPSEAEKISKIAAIHKEAVQLATFETRLSELEALIKEKLK